MNPQRLADIRAGTNARQESCGSGYLVGTGLVLTAHHVIAAPDGVMWPRIDVHIGHPGNGPRVRVSAQVCWSGAAAGRVRHTGIRDVALLQLDPPGKTVEPVRWGRPVGTRRLNYTGMGYPFLAEYEDGVRGVEQLGGTLPPLSTDASGTFVLDQIAAARLRETGERAWGGVSGASVFCNDLLVGVVVKDDEEFENRRLHAQGVWGFADDPEFVDLLQAHTGAAPVIEPVELSDKLDCRMEPVRARTPGSLLAASAEAVPFHGRQRELEELAAWRDGGPSLSVKLVTGEGGQGKSRLARAFCRDSRANGWVAGTTEPTRSVEDSRAQLLRDKSRQERDSLSLVEHLAGCTVPALVVCDYAETHPVFVDTLLSQLAERSWQRPVRVLLLARAPGAWWQELSDRLAAASSRLPLEPLSTDDPTRHEAYTTALTGLAAGLARLPEPPIGQEPVAPWPELAQRLTAEPPDFKGSGNALTLQMIALLALLQAAADGARAAKESPEDRLVEHERDYLRRAAAGKGLFDADALSTATDDALRRRQAIHALDRALAAVVLLGPCAQRTARRIGAFASKGRATQVVDWLADLYPPPPGQHLSIGAVQPDRLGEYLLGGILTETDQHGDLLHRDLLRRTGKHAKTIEAGQSFLSTLLRTASHTRFESVVNEAVTQLIAQRPDPFAAAGLHMAALSDQPRPLLDGLRTLATRKPKTLSEQARRANSVLPETSVALSYFNAAVTGTLMAFFGELTRNNPVFLPDLAGFSSNHAVRLSQVARWEESVSVSTEAVRLWRVAADDDAAHLPHLAMALNNHALRLWQENRWKEALSFSKEALELRRSLASVGDTYELAETMVNHAAHLHRAGEGEEALLVSDDAIRLFRPLDEDHRPGLASALSNHARYLADMGHREDALECSKEAIARYEELTEADEDTHIAGLTGALINHTALLGDLQRFDEALRFSERAVQLNRDLAALDENIQSKDLAGSLHNHASILTGLRRWDEAATLLEEAIDLSRNLAEANPAACLPLLERSVKLNLQLAELRRQDAMPMSAELVRLRRELANPQTGVYLEALAQSLVDHAERLVNAGRVNDAATYSTEATRHYRVLVVTDRSSHLEGLARALYVEAGVLARTGRASKAVVASAEAVRCYRELAEGDRDLYLPYLVSSLTGQGYFQLDRHAFREMVAPLYEASLLTEDLPPDKQGMKQSIINGMRIAYLCDPAGVAAQYRAQTGLEVPPWMQEPPSKPEDPV
ncbi:tetratricopeptide repeat protein [Streptomyces mirabilis]|uniref:tetratricopeptide repeat protein n=1 Tax=Streptomyces mirabilis TaxID=68239 RepID=UPI0036E299F7